MLNIKKHLLMLTGDPAALKATKVYLFNKGWEVHLTQNLKEFLDYLTNKAPDYVVICMDYPSANIRLIPKVISERMRACIIASASKSNLETHKRVNEAGMEFKLIPPISGPSIEKIAERYEYKMRTMVERARIEETRRKTVPENLLKFKTAKLPGETIDYKNMNGKSPGRDQNYEARSGRLLGPLTAPQKKGSDLVLKATEKVITEFVDNQASLRTEKTDKKIVPTQICCMQVETLSFSGYLVAAMGDDFPMGLTFNKLVQKRLNEFLVKSGEVLMPDLDTFMVQLKPVAFLDWAKEYANFLRTAIHRGNQIAFAFFPFKGIRVNYMPSAAPDMLSVPLDEFVADNVVNFDVYLYLATNKKYVLYTPKASTFYSKQKNRLSNRGVTHLHIKRTDLTELNRYKAQKYFDSVISDYSSESQLASA